MSNASTIRRQIGGTQQLTLAPLPSPAVASTIYNFVLNNNGLTLTGGGVIPLSAGVTGLYAGTGQVLHFAATGTVLGLANSTLTLELWEVPAAIIAAGGLTQTSQTGFNSVAAGTAEAVGAINTNWSFDARLQLSATGILTGSFTYTVGATTVGYAEITPVTGLVGEADLNFVMSAEAGTANLTTVTIDEFRLDLE